MMERQEAEESCYFSAFLHLRGVMGRRFNEYGITPLAIFRKVI